MCAAHSPILLLSTADSDLLAARAGDSGWRTGNPARLAPGALAGLLDGVAAVVVRLLGGTEAWPDGLAAVRASGLPTIVLSGERTPDAELMAASTVPIGIATEALAYLQAGGPANLAQLHRFLSDTLLLTGLGFEPPAPMPEHGVLGDRPYRPDRPTVGIVFYRAHALAGNTRFVDTLADAIEAAGGNARPVYCASLRGAGDDLLALLSGVDTLVVTVLAAGGTVPAAASAGGADDAWDLGALSTLDVPVLQAICLTASRRAWLDSDAAMTPMDAGMQVAVPEFDGRLITVPFSFKDTDPDGTPRYEVDPERAARVAGIAVAHARLRHVPPARRRIAIVLSSYPTKHARVGNAVGLDTPASAVALLRRLRAAGYDLGAGFPGEADGDGDALIHALIAAGGHDTEWLTEQQLAAAEVRIPLARYLEHLAALPAPLVERIRAVWGDPPGELYVHDGHLVLASLRFGNVVLLIQPPRGFGENPIAIYHDPNLPPSHHYLAAYRWLERDFGAHAVLHLGKHGTLEWLPGKGLGLSAGCAPDAVLADLPMIYPFIVNDPGEGTQAKRRAHATVVDHLVPPMARAESYGELARLEQLLDEYATVQALDPDKLPVVRQQVWELVQAAQLHHDLAVEQPPDAAAFDDFVLHIDGYLCEVKDSQIRDGLHVLGAAPAGEARINLVLAILRATQVWGGAHGAVPGLRAALAAHFGLDEAALLAEPGARVAVPDALAAVTDGPHRTGSDAVDALERLARSLVTAADGAGWRAEALPAVIAEALSPSGTAATPPAPAGTAGTPPATTATVPPGLDSADGASDLGGPPPDRPLPADVVPDDVLAVLRFAADEVVPRLDATSGELDAVLHALDGGYVPAGPSGSPTRGLVGVLPTGRNFYSVDPKAIPSPNAWQVGSALADSLLARHRADTGRYPASVGLTVWGTSAMRTQGDDVAEVLALLGCRPRWDEASRRVTGFEVVPLAELGRPRVDVTVRISGFFRDAFPHVVAMLDEAVSTVAGLDEPAGDNHVRAHAVADAAEHGDWRRATTRIFGSAPGAYGAGLLPLIDAHNWRDAGDLAEVYAVWGGYAYGAGLDGRSARDELDRAYRRIEVAAKNVDTREHDIADSDDYFQYHGGMVAMVRTLTGRAPAAYLGDSHVPDTVRTRTLAEETHRVFRARVVNPRWIAAMRRHGYKGAFELAATVDYLFGYDATAGVVDDWMYQRLADEYVFDDETREFFDASNPWALRGITERLLEAAERGMWAAPDPATLARLRERYLAAESDLEGDR